MHSRDYAAMTLAERLIKQHEGLRLMPYRCTADKLTIGYGHNLEAKGITKPEADVLLANDMEAVRLDLTNLIYWKRLTSIRKAALIDMRFCLGAAGYRKFKLMNQALVDGDYPEAAAQIMNSHFARQVGQRANTLADMVESG